MSTLAATNFKNPSAGSNNVVLNTDGTTTIAAPSNIIKSGTAVASTSGTAIDFTGIPSWAKRVTVMFSGVSTSGTSPVQLQIGSTTISTTGYLGGTSGLGAAGLNTNNYTSGLVMYSGGGDAATASRHGIMIFTLLGANLWVGSGQNQSSAATFGSIANTSITLSGVLDRIRITTVNGTDTFDAGSINILYEG